MSLLSSLSKLLRLVSAGLLIPIILACSGFGGTPRPTLEPDSFGYCGARLTELCVVSFGRDVFNNTVVNLYVPQRRYPAFYMKIIRKSGEERYDCVWSETVETSVYCAGNAINLGEGIEIQLLAKLDDRLLANGAFTLTAFFVTTPVVEGESGTESEGSIFGGGANPTSDASQTDDATATHTPSNKQNATPTATQPPSGSYPNYP